MLTYIYFVKCPGCEDEHFDFFNDAKEFALNCLSQKPVITQTEVDRNDFGECTNSSDLGTVWSWEEAMGRKIEDEPAVSIFTKDDLKNLPVDEDPEFATLDNSVDFNTEEDVFLTVEDAIDFLVKDEEEAIAGYEKVEDAIKDFEVENKKEILDTIDHIKAEEEEHIEELEALLKADADERKPVPEGMTIEELVEAMEENEDEVECTWCNELFGRDQCRKEVDLGWLCDRCQAAIMSRGEPLTFRENNYWDFLDDDVDTTKVTSWLCFFDDKEVGRVEASTEEEALEKMQQEYPEYHYGLYDGCFYVIPAEGSLEEAFNPKDKVEFIYDSLIVTLQGPKRDVDDWDESEESVRHSFYKTKEDVATDIWENFIEEADTEEVEGGLETLEDDKAWADFLSKHFDDLLDKYYDKLLDYYKDDARKEYEETHSLNESAASDNLVELEYPSLTVTLYGTQRDVDDWDEVEHTTSHVFLVPKIEVATAIWENWITEEDVKDVEGGLETLEDDTAWEKFLETHFDDLFEKYEKQILEYFKEEAAEDFRERSQEEYDMERWSAKQKQSYADLEDAFNESAQKPFLEEFDDAETHKATLVDCPECGSVSYDMKEQYCTNCGFNL